MSVFSHRTVTLGGRFCDDRVAASLLEMLLGGMTYGLLEIVWRGYTHPSMVLTGGVCFGMMLAVNRYCVRLPLVLRSGLCALGITAAEFCVGFVVNRLWHMEVWDYSDEWMDLLGQICPLYSCFWFLLSFAVCGLFEWYRRNASLKRLKSES